MKKEVKTWENTTDSKDKYRYLVAQLNKITGFGISSRDINSRDEGCECVYKIVERLDKKIKSLESLKNIDKLEEKIIIEKLRPLIHEEEIKGKVATALIDEYKERILKLNRVIKFTLVSSGIAMSVAAIYTFLILRFWRSI